MGWPVTAQPKVETIHAKRLWGRGRGLQLLTRAYCAVKGHTWRAWVYDWPEYDISGVPEISRAIEFGPTPDEPLLWMRGCTRGCGTVQHTTLPLKREQELPR